MQWNSLHVRTIGEWVTLESREKEWKLLPKSFGGTVLGPPWIPYTKLYKTELISSQN